MDYTLLKKLYEIHSPSGSEKKLKRYISRYVSEHIKDTIISYDRSGNMYLVKGSAENYPCLVAHLDQVQHKHAKDFIAVETEDIIFGYSPKKRERQGLGADDKNGIWVALKCLEEFDVLKIALFVGEEIGCVGSGKADMEFFKDCRFAVQIDRKGYGDLITSIYDDICSREFEQALNADKFGYKATHGLMTDVAELSEKGIGISCVNMSCGYYEPHTSNEFTVKADLENCLNFVRNIVANCTDVYTFEYDRHSVWKGWDDWYGVGYTGNKTAKDFSSVEDFWENAILANLDYSDCADEIWYIIQEDSLAYYPNATEEEFLEFAKNEFDLYRYEDLVGEEDNNYENI